MLAFNLNPFSHFPFNILIVTNFYRCLTILTTFVSREVIKQEFMLKDDIKREFYKEIFRRPVIPVIIYMLYFFHTPSVIFFFIYIYTLYICLMLSNDQFKL